MGWSSIDKVEHHPHLGWIENDRGEERETWDDWVEVPDGAWAPGSTSEDLAEGHRLESSGTLIFQRAFTYSEFDEFKVNGITYQVVGHASTIRRNPFTGTVLGTDIALKAVV